MSESTPPPAGIGPSRGREIELVWTGISERNGEACALIQYRAFFSGFETAISATSLRGSSHYWGDIWVSLEDKEIEHATIFEDISIEIGGDDEETRRTEVLRVGRLEKLAPAGK